MLHEEKCASLSQKNKVRARASYGEVDILNSRFQGSSCRMLSKETYHSECLLIRTVLIKPLKFAQV